MQKTTTTTEACPNCGSTAQYRDGRCGCGLGHSSSGNPVYRGYAISVVNDKEGKFLLCGQWYQTLEEATAQVDRILEAQQEDLCPSCGYHVTRCRMTDQCVLVLDPEA